MATSPGVVARAWRLLMTPRASTEVAAPSKGTNLSASFAVVAGLTAAEILRQGAFYTTDALVVAVVSAGLILTCLVLGIDRRSLWVTLAIGGCALWWLFSAVHHGQVETFLPLGSSMVGFLAAFLVVRRLDQRQRSGATLVLATIGAAAGAVGLAASVMRWYPLAMPAQNLWRLSTTLTYSNAAGLLLGVPLLVALALDQRRWLARVDVALCMAGLVATQSRGAVLGVLVGAALVPLAAFRRSLRPLVAGMAGGLIVVGTSSGPTHQPLAGIALGVVALGVGVIKPPLRLRRLTRRQVVTAAVGTVLIAGFAVAALHNPIQRRVQLASTSARITIWHAAFDQWRSSPWIGVGPDAIITFQSAEGTYDHFAHNEYLQVLADAGAVGELLLLVAAGTTAAAIRREDTLSSCATAGLVAFAVAGAFDFDWHLSALGLVGGWVAGLAGCPKASLPTAIFAVPSNEQ